MPRSRADIPTVLALAGAAALAAVALRGLPWTAGLVAPPTPFTHSLTPSLAPAYALLVEADAVVPRGASAVVRAQPRDARLESHFFRLGLALLPGRRVLPSAEFDAFTPPEIGRAAEYEIVVGERPAEEAGEIALRTAEGSVFRRRPR
ncbi:MAG: hypothetical protein ACM3NW_11755 [Syntrophomonadaceae bacterium]